MTTVEPVMVKLDRERGLVFTQRALFRMGSLPAPFEFDDMSRPRKSYAALVAWVWACLTPQDAQDFRSPEDLALHIPTDREFCLRLSEALVQAINAGATEKKAQSSTPGSSPASS